MTRLGHHKYALDVLALAFQYLFIVLRSFLFETTGTLLNVSTEYFFFLNIFLGVNKIVIFGEWKTLVSEQILIILTSKDLDREQI